MDKRISILGETYQFIKDNILKNILFAYNIVEHDNEYVSRLVEIAQGIENLKVTVSLEEFWNPKIKYDAVIINWPDYLFRWKRDISDTEVEKLIYIFDHYKKNGTQIITVLHDEYAHHSRSQNRDRIFDICYQECDVLAHLGNYSLKKYSDLYKHLPATHKLLFHPSYRSFDLSLSGEKTRNLLDLKKKDFIIIVPGGIRHQYEEDYVNKIFENIKIKNKKLIYLRASHINKPAKAFTFSFISFKLKERYLQIFKKTSYKYKFLPSPVLSAYFVVSDLIILPRLDILNSGNVILGTQYDKLIIGPEIGNIKEWLEKFDQISIDPNSIQEDSFSKNITGEILTSLKRTDRCALVYDDNVIAKQLSDILFM